MNPMKWLRRRLARKRRSAFVETEVPGDPSEEVASAPVSAIIRTLEWFAHADRVAAARAAEADMETVTVTTIDIALELGLLRPIPLLGAPAIGDYVVETEHAGPCVVVLTTKGWATLRRGTLTEGDLPEHAVLTRSGS